LRDLYGPGFHSCRSWQGRWGRGEYLVGGVGCLSPAAGRTSGQRSSPQALEKTGKTDHDIGLLLSGWTAFALPSGPPGQSDSWTRTQKLDNVPGKPIRVGGRAERRKRSFSLLTRKRVGSWGGSARRKKVVEDRQEGESELFHRGPPLDKSVGLGGVGVVNSDVDSG